MRTNIHELEKILERLGAYICDELCCHRDIGADRGEYAMQEICEKCELSGYLDEIRKCLSCENNTEITRFSRDSDWILVSERLPEEGKEVLAGHNLMAAALGVFILWFGCVWSTKWGSNCLASSPETILPEGKGARKKTGMKRTNVAEFPPRP